MQNDIDMGKLLEDCELVVWGTGTEAEYFIHKMLMYQEFWRETTQEQLWHIDRFWDRDPYKQKIGFRNWAVIQPQPESLAENQICIFAFLGYQKYRTLFRNTKGKIGGIFQRKFLHHLRLMFLDHCEDVFNGLVKRNLVQFPILHRENLLEEFQLMDFSRISGACCAIKKSELSDLSKSMMCNILISVSLKSWAASGYTTMIWESLKKTIPFNELISALEFFCGQEIDNVADFFAKYSWKKRNREVQTIGIYNKTYRNGGGPKVISLLMPIYIKMGYRIVFFTDECVPNDEYPLPKEVIRIVLKNKYGEDTSKRLLELGTLVQQYEIDVMCYHHRINEADFFYDLIFLKAQGVYVLPVPHLMFMMLIKAGNGMERYFHKVYGIADALIVLSKANQVFWKDMGCHAIYIPNPIEKGIERLRRPIDYSKRHGNTVLWAGRIEQNVKNVLDVIDIMRYLLKVCPKARLRIVGNIESRSTYETLKQQLSYYRLEKAIELCEYSPSIDTFYETADVFLMTSRMEAFPMVIAESKLHGVPLVLYELSNVELLRDGKGYICVPQRDTVAIAQALAMLLTNEKLRLKMSADARESIVPFVYYDVAGAWQRVFQKLGYADEERTAIVGNDRERKMVYKLLLSRIWEQQE